MKPMKFVCSVVIFIDRLKEFDYDDSKSNNFHPYISEISFLVIIRNYIEFLQSFIGKVYDLSHPFALCEHSSLIISQPLFFN